MKTTQQINEFTGGPMMQPRPERERQVFEWLNELHGAAQELDDTCSQLWRRLYPAMRSEPTVDCKTACGIEIEIELVEIAHSIRMAVQIVNSTTKKHREILHLLEI